MANTDNTDIYAGTAYRALSTAELELGTARYFEGDVQPGDLDNAIRAIDEAMAALVEARALIQARL